MDSSTSTPPQTPSGSVTTIDSSPMSTTFEAQDEEQTNTIPHETIISLPPSKMDSVKDSGLLQVIASLCHSFWRFCTRLVSLEEEYLDTSSAGSQQNKEHLTTPAYTKEDVSVDNDAKKIRRQPGDPGQTIFAGFEDLASDFGYESMVEW